MNKKGFTLVELMVVIVIIGILAAVAAPKLSDNINSAKCNEVPKNFKKLVDKAVEYEAQNGVWPTTAQLVSDGTNSGLVNVNSELWQYTVTSNTTDENITIQAAIKATKKIGAMQAAETLSINNEGGKTYSHDDMLAKYMKAYLAGASKV